LGFFQRADVAFIDLDLLVRPTATFVQGKWAI